MAPVTHLFASWIVAAKTTDNLRDRRLVALSGILPDLDGAGILVDLAKQVIHGEENFFFYQRYHHYLLHGLFGAVLIAAVLACFARDRARVAVLSFLLVHLHLLCDLVGSRGPSPEDVWPIFYLGPFSKEWMWAWKGQWALDAWPNRLLSVFLFGWCLKLAVARGDSFVGVFNRRLDHIFVSTLRGWWTKWKASQR
jgi:hypothetical protein